MKPLTVGRYEIIEELGRGGMATVYRAYDPRFEREIAVKVLPAEFLHDPTFRARFEREAKAVASLEHPAIVPVHDFGEEQGQPYLVMRLMPGGSLADRLAHGPLSLSAAAEILNRLAPALDAAHAAGLIHRDLKPENILFDHLDNPYLSDFGIVKLSESSVTALTNSGGALGTPAYMSPEQARGQVELDGRSDVYTLGVIFFEMLTGTRPYKADTPMGLAMMHVLEPVPRILDAQPALPVDCQEIINWAMAKDRAQRCPTAATLATAVNRLAEGEISVEAPVSHTVTEPTIPFEKQTTRAGSRPWIWGRTAVLLTLFAAISLIGLVYLTNRRTPASDSEAHSVALVETLPPPSPSATAVATPLPPREPVAVELSTDGNGRCHSCQLDANGDPNTPAYAFAYTGLTGYH
jgi:serine/threonine protein kinase